MRTYTRIEGRCVYKGNGNDAVTKRSLQTDRGVPIFLSSSFSNLWYATTYPRCTAKPMYYVFSFRFFIRTSSEVNARCRRWNKKRLTIIWKKERKKCNHLWIWKKSINLLSIDSIIICYYRMCFFKNASNLSY